MKSILVDFEFHHIFGGRHDGIELVVRGHQIPDGWKRGAGEQWWG
jgi:hypothetical protein